MREIRKLAALVLTLAAACNGSLKAGPMRPHRLVVPISFFLLLAASCGGGGTEDATPTPTCTTVTPGPDGSLTPTPTPCLVGATGAPPSAEPTGGPVGESWKGTTNITSSAVWPGAGTCRDGWELEFMFGVGSDGTIEGQGTGELTSAPTCPFPITSPSWDHVEIQVLGEETAGGFSLRFALVSFEPAAGATYAGFVAMFGGGTLPLVGSPVAVAVSGTSGTGQGMWQIGSAAETASGKVEVTCVNCEVAVG